MKLRGRVLAFYIWGSSVNHRGRGLLSSGGNKKQWLSASLYLWSKAAMSSHIIDLQYLGSRALFAEPSFPKLYASHSKNMCTVGWGWEVKLKEINPDLLSKSYSGS